MGRAASPDIHSGIGFLLKMRRDPLNFFISMAAEHHYAWFRVGGKNVLLLADPAGIRHVLQDRADNYDKSAFANVLKPLLGRGIFLSDRALWLKQRRETAPVFANGNFPEMTAQMVDAAQAMLARIEPRAKRGEPVDMTVETMWFALDVVFRALFHTDNPNVAREMKDSLGLLLKEAERRIWALASLPQSVVLGLPKYKKALALLDRVVASLIAERERNKAYPEDLLSRLIENYDSTLDERRVLRDQVMSFMLAGHETTANGLTWSLYETARSPAIKAHMFAEIDQVLGNASPTYETALALPYTRQVFDEALRLYPPVWTMSRDALDHDIIPTENGGRIPMPKGATAMLCAYAMHRQARYWPSPDTFDPNRFTPEEMAARHKFAYFPFGAGPRLCLGFRFAQIESVIALAMLAQRYDWQLAPGQNIQPEPVITLRPDGPVYFHLKARNINFT